MARPRSTASTARSAPDPHGDSRDERPASIADPRPRNRPLLIGAIVVYAVCLAAVAAIAIWGP